MRQRTTRSYSRCHALAPPASAAGRRRLFQFTGRCPGDQVLLLPRPHYSTPAAGWELEKGGDADRSGRANVGRCIRLRLTNGDISNRAREYGLLSLEQAIPVSWRFAPARGKT